MSQQTKPPKKEDPLKAIAKKLEDVYNTYKATAEEESRLPKKEEETQKEFEDRTKNPAYAHNEGKAAVEEFYHSTEHKEEALELFNAQVYFNKRMGFEAGGPIPSNYYKQLRDFLTSDTGLAQYRQHQRQHQQKSTAYEEDLAEFQKRKPVPMTSEMETLQAQIQKEASMESIDKYIAEKNLQKPQISTVLNQIKQENDAAKQGNTDIQLHQRIDGSLTTISKKHELPAPKSAYDSFQEAIALSDRARELGKEGNLPIYEALQTYAKKLDEKSLLALTQSKYDFGNGDKLDPQKIAEASKEMDSPRGQIARYLIDHYRSCRVPADVIAKADGTPKNEEGKPSSHDKSDAPKARS